MKHEVLIVGGAGHIGLPLGILFACDDRRTHIYDINETALLDLKSGQVPFVENGAEGLLKVALQNNTIEIGSDISVAKNVHYIVITINSKGGEIFQPEDDTLRAITDQLCPYIRDDQNLIIRSTVAPGTTAWLAHYLQRKGLHPLISYCPERIVQGNAINEIQTLPQIVSGVSPAAVAEARDLFSSVAPECIEMSVDEAEYAKLFTNSYRYIQFAASNQFYMMATQAGLDYSKIVSSMKRGYPRLSDFPTAGFVGGPCLIKDTKQLISIGQGKFQIGVEAMRVNHRMPQFIVERMEAEFDLSRMVVGLLGMAFKAESEDTRTSVSYDLKEMLSSKVQKIMCTDPFVQDDESLFSLNRVLEESDVLIICTPHKLYKDIVAKDKKVIDIWGVLNASI